MKTAANLERVPLEYSECVAFLIGFYFSYFADLAMIKKSLLSWHIDFEDAIQIFAATSLEELDFIETRNIKAFKDAGVAVMPPDLIPDHL